MTLKTQITYVVALVVVNGIAAWLGTRAGVRDAFRRK